MGTKLVELLANWVVERRNMINDYLRGRACIERVRGVLILSFCADFELFLLFQASVLILSVSCSSKLFLALSCHFA
jgi:hypothetical protein